jgi:hypothetical protein
MTDQRRIILAGDSWACGEWGRDLQGRYRPLHPGLQYYLRRAGHGVRVVAQGQAGNGEQLERVQAEAQPGDLVVFVQTDPLRDSAVIPGDQVAFLDQYQQGLQALYRALAQLPCPVLLVGGNSPVLTDLIDPGSPCRVAVADWIEELGLDRPCPVICRAWSYPDCEPPLLEQWERDEQQLREWLHRCGQSGTPEHEWFWPDGRHPNRRAHSWLAARLRALMDP